MPPDENLAIGFHAVISALEQGAGSVERVWLDQERNDTRAGKILQLASTTSVKVQRVPKAKLDALAGNDARHQGVVARIRQVRTGGEAGLEAMLQGIDGTPLLLVLDGIQDPHNLGACLRSAAGAGVHAVILPKDRSAPLSATVRKSASGAVDKLALFQVSNLARTLEKLKASGIWLVGTSGEAESDLYQCALSLPVAIVMGSEAKGMRQRTRELCDYLVRIPVAGDIESLNVAVATGICLFEALRQRRAQ